MTNVELNEAEIDPQVSGVDAELELGEFVVDSVSESNGSVRAINPEIMKVVKAKREERLRSRALDGIKLSKNGNVANGASDSVTHYINQMRYIERFSDEEEFKVGAVIKDTTDTLEADKLTEGQRSKFDIEENEVTDDQRIRLEEMRDQAISLMVSRNLRLGVTMANKYKPRDMEFSDAIQVGTLGLFNAAEKFDPYKGFKFSTYATWWIKQAVQRKGSEFRLGYLKIPARKQTILREMRRLNYEQTDSGGEALDVTEFASRLDEKPEAIKALMPYVADVGLVSLNVAVGEDGVERGDFISDPDKLDTASGAISEVFVATVVDLAREVLDERTYDIFVRRVGLDGHEPQTLDVVAEVHNISRDRIRHIANGAARKLERKLNPND